jgi:MFS family permease
VNNQTKVSLFRALRHKNFALFISGQGISVIGTWMQSIAMSWLVYRLTGSAFLLGFVGFISQLPTFVIAPFAGVVADRFNRRNIIVVTQILAMLQAFTFAALVLTNTIAVWHIMALGLFMGIVTAQDIPARQSFIHEMIEDKDDLGNAIALNSSMFNAARLIGPAIAGIVIAAVGEGVCFLLNGISYIAVIIALMAMTIKPGSPRSKNGHVVSDIKEGFRYAFGFPPIRSILLLLSLVSLIGAPYAVLMPVIARDILHGGPHTLGFLVGSAGVGALAGAIYLASRKSVLGLDSWIARACGIFAIGLIALSFSHVFWLSVVLIPIIGFGMMIQMASSNTIIQTIVKDDKRGRVMSIYTMSFMGIAPLGSLLAGSLASTIGTQHTLLIGGCCCFIGSIVFMKGLPSLRNLIHPIYAEKGILPQIAEGIETASELTVPPED